MTPIERQAKTWTNDDESLVKPLGANSSKIVINIYNVKYIFIHWKEMHSKWCAQGRSGLFGPLN